MLGLVRPLFARLKSPVFTPVTLSLNVTANWMLVEVVEHEPVGTQLMEDTVGAVTSHVTVLSVAVDAVLLLPAGSVTVAAAIVAITVPVVVMPLTAMLNVVPLF